MTDRSTGQAAPRLHIATATLGALAALAPVTLYQLGIVRHLPDPPLPGFDADKVHASPQAYPVGSIPDGAIGIASYGVTLALSLAASPERSQRRAWLPLALAAKVGFDLTQVVRLTWIEIAELRALSCWSLFAGAATLSCIAPALQEARAALRSAALPSGR